MTINIDALVNAPVRDKLDTEFAVTPAGEYIATISDRGTVKDWFRVVKMKDGREAPQCNVLFIINDPGLAATLGRQTATSRLTLWLDTEADGSLATGHGRNVNLGQLREALGQNSDTEWTFDKLLGAGPVKILTEVQESDRGGKFSNVTRVGKVSDALKR